MKLADYMIECERRAYLATGNPLHVWNAYSTVRAKRMDLPEWILRYFDKASWGIREIATDDVKRKDLGPRIGRSLGLVNDGPGTPFEFDRKWWAYGRAVREYMKAGHDRDDARAFAAVDFEVHEMTIVRNEQLYDLAFPGGEDEIVIDEGDLPDLDLPDIEADYESAAGIKKAGEAAG